MIHRLHYKWRINYSIILFQWLLPKFLDKYNTTFKEDIEASSKKEVAEQLQLHNDVMMDTTNQRFTSFQCVILKKWNI